MWINLLAAPHEVNMAVRLGGRKKRLWTHCWGAWLHGAKRRPFRLRSIEASGRVVRCGQLALCTGGNPVKESPGSVRYPPVPKARLCQW